MKPYSRILSLFVVGWMCASCAMLTGGRPDPELAAQYVRSAQDLERQGDQAAALEQYKLALTADPQNQTAKENSERLTRQLAQLADERYQLGMKYHAQGKYGLARKEFLTALKYQPDHPQASKMLVSREPEKTPKYVYHVIKPGESLSMIAKTYYGDYQKYHVIAQFNDIDDATKVKPGQRIMIPEIDAMPPLKGIAERQGSATYYVEHVLRPGESISKLAQQYYGDYKQFHVIAQFNGMEDATQVKVGQTIKVPKVAGLPFHDAPVNAVGHKAQSAAETIAPAEVPPSDAYLTANQNGGANEIETQIIAYRDSGIDLFDEGRYEDAIFELNKAIEASPNDAQTRDYLSRAYFESGRQLFDQHDYDAAQEAFESALQYNPQCKQCTSFIEKSKIGPLIMHRNKGLDYFNNNQLSLAIQEFEKYLMNQPQDKEIRTYLSKAYFEQAMTAYDKGDYMIAKKGFEAAAANDANCQQCATYIDRCLVNYKEAHYNKGIIHFGKEQLTEAIAEWEKVYEVDPGYKEVEQNLSQARRLLEKLERIKKSNQ